MSLMMLTFISWLHQSTTVLVLSGRAKHQTFNYHFAFIPSYNFFHSVPQIYYIYHRQAKGRKLMNKPRANFFLFRGCKITLARKTKKFNRFFKCLMTDLMEHEKREYSNLLLKILKNKI